jgi:exonuclease III
MLHSWTTLRYTLGLPIIAKVLTLNTRSIKGEGEQIQLALYAKRQKADILLLQETNISDIAELPELPFYNVIQNTAIQVGSGTAIIILAELQFHMSIHSHHNIITSYKSHHLVSHRTQLINIYLEINTTRVMTIVNALKKHMETVPLDRKIRIGGDWNITLEARDRAHHLEKRTALAQ